MPVKKAALPLRATLAALYAEAALEADGGQPPEDAVRRALDASVGKRLSPAKRTLLLRATLAGGDVGGAASRMTPARARATLGTPEPEGLAEASLTLEHVRAMLPEMWRQCVTWLLEQEGYAAEVVSATESVLTVRCERAATHGVEVALVWALRPLRGKPVTEEDVSAVSEAARSERDVRAMLLTPAEATVGAVVAARQQDVRLIGGDEVRELLARSATAFERQAQEALREQEQRAVSAAAARADLLHGLAEVTHALGTSTRTTIAKGRALLGAVTDVQEAQRTLAMASMAWDTLLAEWTQGFGERPARNGTLNLMAEPEQYAALAERGTHLAQVLRDAALRIVGTPSEGEMGYTEWRRGVREELAARLASYVARVQAVNPDVAQNFTSAVDDALLQKSSQRRAEAEHAAARAAKAFGELRAHLNLDAAPAGK